MARPNILLFATDDHGAWALGCQHNAEVRSSTLDRLAAEGARFPNAFTPSPVCSPARACLLTGRTPSQVGIHDWLEEALPDVGDRDWVADEVTLPQLLRNSGYTCGLSGKWHLGRSHETPKGFDWCFGLPRWQGKHIEPYTYHLNGAPLTLDGNKTERITDHALGFLESRPRERPFFLNVSYIATHSPYAGQEPGLLDLYRDATFAGIPAYEPHPWRKNEGFANNAEFDPGQRRDSCANYYAAVSDIDRNVGRLIHFLEQNGSLRDTIVIYTSDHGLTLGHHGFWGKGNSTRPLNMYETSLRIPLIWHWPAQIPANRVIEHCVDHYDTFQTICELADVDLDRARNYPGRSYRKALFGDALDDWRETRFGEYGDLRMIRTPEWKLVIRYPAGPHDLFNLLTDPGEAANLSGLAGYIGVEADLRRQLDAFYAGHEDARRSGLIVKELPRHNARNEAWRDGIRESRGLQIY